MKKIFMYKYLLLLIFGGISSSLFGQTIIGSFPQMDGGFENQANGSIATLSSLANSVQRVDWTVSAGSGSALVNPLNGRSGNKYFTVGSTSTTARRFQSPTAANGAILSATGYTTQFYYKTAAATGVTNAQSNASTDGTGSGGTYQALTLNGTNGTWTKVQQAVTTGSSAATTKYGLSFFRFSNISTVDVDIDDETMTQITKMTGGKYFRATDRESLEKTYKEIDLLEKTIISEQSFTNKAEHF